MFHTKYTRIQQITTVLEMLAFGASAVMFFASMLFLA